MQNNYFCVPFNILLESSRDVFKGRFGKDCEPIPIFQIKYGLESRDNMVWFVFRASNDWIGSRAVYLRIRGSEDYGYFVNTSPNDQEFLHDLEERLVN